MQAKITQSIKPLADELLIGIFLAATGGFLDAYTYFFRGGVFANAQTGNMVLMAIYASKCDFNKAVYYLIPITAFFLGVLATEYLMRHGRLGGRWRQIVLALEIIILFCIGFLSQNVPNAYINVAVSFVCSLQVNAFKKILRCRRIEKGRAPGARCSQTKKTNRNLLW